MEFQTLFTSTRSILKTVPSLRWVDLDKGQLEHYSTRPSVAFPCALIGTNIVRAKNRNHFTQECEAAIILRVAFDYTGETNAEVDDELLEESLAYFKIADEVYKALQGKSDGSTSPLSRVSQTEEPPRADGIKVLRFTITTSFIDNSAKPKA